MVVILYRQFKRTKIMSLDISFKRPLPEDCTKCKHCETVKESLGKENLYLNVTHNHREMAEEAGIYYAMWRPEEIGLERASDVLPYLLEGLDKLQKDPEKYKKFNPKNGWENYEGFVDFVQKYINCCILYPTHFINVWR